ncbi:MAG TPA: dTDP-4-dehydrorhamnose reductase [Dehalococcoidia bacterium]|nr:dTDP-4-dehydrorhamnose reductase [Dehalococcoidia bacterium]
MRVLVLGGHGQLASDITRLWTNLQPIPLGHQECDVTDRASIDGAIAAHRADLVLNTAAYHKVDDCEGEGALAAFAVNVLGAKNVADACREADLPYAWLSTDYVFSGSKGAPYREGDAPDPVSMYGVSKAAGEHAVRYANSRHYIIRTSGLYGIAGASGKGGNFVETMLRLARERKPIRVVNDQRLAPTSTADLAIALERLLVTEAYGTYHITNAGECSWYEFAGAIFAFTQAEVDFEPTTSNEFGAAARRPAYSVLANERLTSLGIEQPRPWREALEAYLGEKGYLR